ncbi:hypothetical protein FHX34_102947 [Actinoplanes teichomyceticus]|uniref:Uncharacterized protein n=1 Tax=Actinoplanes teichomyceticus TaxID=1867 RepID=A0A561WKJ9_ACTTI|nr:hypothetical protein FHX34_102947 [Actinoplanes teichomyceticus]
MAQDARNCVDNHGEYDVVDGRAGFPEWHDRIPSSATSARDNEFMRQLSLFGRTELQEMRDRTRSRRHSAAGDAFRREHECRRAWGLQRRHADRLRRADPHHAGAPAAPATTNNRTRPADPHRTAPQTTPPANPAHPADSHHDRCGTTRGIDNPPPRADRPTPRSGPRAPATTRAATTRPWPSDGPGHVSRPRSSRPIHSPPCPPTHSPPHRPTHSPPYPPAHSPPRRPVTRQPAQAQPRSPRPAAEPPRRSSTGLTRRRERADISRADPPRAAKPPVKATPGGPPT